MKLYCESNCLNKNMFFLWSIGRGGCGRDSLEKKTLILRDVRFPLID